MSQIGILREGSTLPGIETVTGDSGGAVAGAGSPVNVNIVGTAGQITVTGNPGTSTLTLALAGGGTAIDSINVDANTAPGTDPVVPDSNGLMTVTGAIAVAGTNPIRTNSLAANTYTIQVQTSQALAATDSTKIGLCNFDSADFAVDANGFVTTVAGAEVINVTVVNTTPYPAISTDYFLAVDCSGGIITVQLPNAPTTGRTFVIKDSTGSSNTNNITLTTVGGIVLIDAAATYTINTNYYSLQVVFDGIKYLVF